MGEAGHGSGHGRATRPAMSYSPHGLGTAGRAPSGMGVWGSRGKTQAPMEGKNIWRLCKTYGRMIGYPMLKPHDLRYGAAMRDSNPCFSPVTYSSIFRDGSHR